MNILTIMNGHNATVSLFSNGTCTDILHEEKFSNIKNHVGFPHLSLKYLLEKRIHHGKIDKVLFVQQTHLSNGSPKNISSKIESLSQGSIIRAIYNWLEYKTAWKWLFRKIRKIIMEKYITPKVKKDVKEFFCENYGISEDKIEYINHHEAHALSPIYFYGLTNASEKILLMTIDGHGDGACSKVMIFDPLQKKWETIAETPYDASIGLMYSGITQFLGMKPSEHEYKVMGLAAYVTEDKYWKKAYEILKKTIWVNEEKLTFESKWNTNLTPLFLRRHCAEIRFDSLSAAIQKLTEDVVLQWITAAIKKTGITTIALSGGVFMNVKMNQKIIALKDIKKVYFQPGCGDESLGIGAAGKWFLEKEIALKPIRTMFLGNPCEQEEIEKITGDAKGKWKVERHENMEEVIAELLAQGKVVARCTGNGEWGARSLCNRAVLGNAVHMKTFFEINDMIKMRDFWMPFAPSILEEWAPKYIENWDEMKEKAYESTKFMIMTMKATPLAQTHLRAALHQKDKTLRPQIVSKNENPLLHHLISLFSEKTGIGGILNTSLNIHGFPLVGSAHQALETFENSGLQYLALNNVLMSKDNCDHGNGIDSI